MEETICRRCGRCCHYVVYDKHGKPRLKKCKHLVKLKSGRALCRIYGKRKMLQYSNGIEIDRYKINGEVKKVFCIWRMNAQFNYEGCPFNVNGAVPFDKYLKDIGVGVKQ